MPHHYIITVLLLVATGCGSSDIRSLRDLGLSDWPQLEANLSAAVPKTLASNESVYDRILDAEAAKTIHANGTPDFWAEMCDSGSPLVSVLGFRCINENSQQDAFHAALAVLAHRTTSLYLFPEPARLVNDAKPTEGNKNTFYQFVTNPKHEKLKLDDVTSFLNQDFLQDWALTADLQSVPAKVQAMAVGEVYAKSLADGSSVPVSVAKIFDSFDKSFGDRLAVFVWYAPESDDRLSAAIARLLQDDQVPLGMYQVALSQKIKFIKSSIHADALELTAEQQQRYDRFCQSAARRESGEQNAEPELPKTGF